MIKQDKIQDVAVKINLLVMKYSKRHGIEKYCKPVNHEIIMHDKAFSNVLQRIRFKISEIDMQKVFDDHVEKHGIDITLINRQLSENGFPLDVFIKTHYLEYHILKLIIDIFTKNVSSFTKQDMKNLNDIWKK